MDELKQVQKEFFKMFRRSKVYRTICIYARRARDPAYWRTFLMANRRPICLTVLFAFAIYLLYLFHFFFPPAYVRLPAYVDTSKHELLQPDVTDDFPTIDSSAPKIPHILHQTAKSTCIEHDNVKYIKSFIDNNPHWKYYFWTDESARRLIKQKYPELLETWDGIQKGIEKSDFLRILVLYEYGGIYADTDVENIRSLDRVTWKYTCILPTEPLEHSAFLYRIPFVMNNAIILCQPGHPFLKEVLSSFKISLNNNGNTMLTTGPLFITDRFIKYNKYMYLNDLESVDEFTSVLGTGMYKDLDDKAVFVPNTHYFTDNLDTWASGGQFSYICSTYWFRKALQQRACIDIAYKGLYRKNKKFVYTIHHWQHSWCSKYRSLTKFWAFITGKECIDIRHIVPPERLNFLEN